MPCQSHPYVHSEQWYLTLALVVVCLAVPKNPGHQVSRHYCQLIRSWQRSWKTFSNFNISTTSCKTFSSQILVSQTLGCILQWMTPYNCLPVCVCVCVCARMHTCVCICVFILIYIIVHLKVDFFLYLNSYVSTVYIIYQKKQTIIRHKIQPIYFIPY